MQKQYNGYPSWAQWNVSLWINNNEGLYRMALYHAKRKPVRRAAVAILRELEESGMRKTPDGAKYTITAIAGAIRGMS